jgi:peptide/nickel transport system substrate-binding protein
VTSIAANGQDIILTLSAPDSTLLWNLTGRAGLVFKEGDTIDRKTKANGTGPTPSPTGSRATRSR